MAYLHCSLATQLCLVVLYYWTAWHGEFLHAHEQQLAEHLHAVSGQKLCQCFPENVFAELVCGHALTAFSLIPLYNCACSDTHLRPAELLSGKMMAWTTSSILVGVLTQTCWSSYLPTAMSASASLTAGRSTLTPVPSSRPFLSRVSTCSESPCSTLQLSCHWPQACGLVFSNCAKDTPPARSLFCAVRYSAE